MVPSLFTLSILTVVVLLVIGVPLMAVPSRSEAVVRAFPRNRVTALVTMVLGGHWFLWKITQLGQSDFGDYKNLLFLLFAAAVVGSVLYVQDFLTVRGLAILVLLSANTGLKSSFGHYEVPVRLLLVTILYLLIVAALIFRTIPYKMRDLIKWLYLKQLQKQMAGILFSIMAVTLLVSAFQY
jgi:hypothetical protein